MCYFSGVRQGKGGDGFSFKLVNEKGTEIPTTDTSAPFLTRMHMLVDQVLTVNIVSFKLSFLFF